MNQILLTGTVKDGVKFQTTQTGLSMARMTLVVQRNNGKGKDFFRVTFWRDLADKAEAELVDGMAVGVAGAMSNDRYQDKTTQEWKDSWNVNASGFEVLTGAPAGGLDTEAGW